MGPHARSAPRAGGTEVKIEMEYSERFKSRMVAKMVGPHSVSANALVVMRQDMHRLLRIS